MASTSKNLQYFIVRRISDSEVEFLVGDFNSNYPSKMKIHDFYSVAALFSTSTFQFLVNDELLKNPMFAKLPKAQLMSLHNYSQTSSWEEIVLAAADMVAWCKGQDIPIPTDFGKQSPKLNEIGLLFLYNGKVYDEQGNWMFREDVDPKIFTQRNIRINMSEKYDPLFTKFSNQTFGLMRYLFIFQKNRMKLRYQDKIQLSDNSLVDPIQFLQVLGNEYPEMKLSQIRDIININRPKTLEELRKFLSNHAAENNKIPSVDELLKIYSIPKHQDMTSHPATVPPTKPLETPKVDLGIPKDVPPADFPDIDQDMVRNLYKQWHDNIYDKSRPLDKFQKVSKFSEYYGIGIPEKMLLKIL